MAEVYLNYVEAMNELDATYTVDGVTVSRDQAEMKRCFNLIRYRVGLPGITAVSYTHLDVYKRQPTPDWIPVTICTLK